MSDEHAGSVAEGADPPSLAQAARDLGKAGVASGRAAWDVLAALRELVAADLALSRRAFGLTLAWTGAAIALGGSAWCFLMASFALLLHEIAGQRWSIALGAPALVSLLGAGWAAWRAVRLFDDTRLDATRRQLLRLLGSDDADATPHDPERGK